MVSLQAREDSWSSKEFCMTRCLVVEPNLISQNPFQATESAQPGSFLASLFLFMIMSTEKGGKREHFVVLVDKCPGFSAV